MRRLVNIVTAVSLVLCLATVALWIRSVVGPEMYLRMTWDPVSRIHRQDQAGLFAGGVSVGVAHTRVDPPPASDALWRDMQQPWSRSGGDYYRHPFPLPRSQLWFFDNQPPRRSRTMPASSSHWAVVFRLWPLAAVTAVLPGVWLGRKVRRRRQRRDGCCPSCGYDLRATPDRCPECGAPVGDAAGTAA